MPPALWSHALVELAQVGDEVSASDAASTRLSWVIWGLLGLAAVISVATVVFWWLTHPDRDGGSRGVPWSGRRGGTHHDDDPTGTARAADVGEWPGGQDRTDRAE